VIRVSFPPSEWKGRTTPAEGRISVVGNVFIAGADTRLTLPMVAGAGEVYERDNRAEGPAGRPRLVVDPQIQVLSEKPVWPPTLSVWPSNEVFDCVIRTVGARPWQRDPIDQRIVDSVRRREGRIIDSQEEVGGYPLRDATRRQLGAIPEGIEARRRWLESMEGNQ